MPPFDNDLPSLENDFNSRQAMRAFDAAANRTLEGLRVVEDIVRFGADDRYLTEQLKKLRHRITQSIALVPVTQRLQARDTLADIGTDLRIDHERDRENLSAVVSANFQRAAEGLRTLAELAKIVRPSTSEGFEQARYQLYTLQRALVVSQEGIRRLDNANFYVIIAGGESLDEFRRFVAALVDARVDIIQLRDKEKCDRDLVQFGLALRELTWGSDTRYIMNDRADLARATRADGVHLGQTELPVNLARKIVGPDALIGVSTHALNQARQAVLDGASYIGVGPTFPSTTKSFNHFPGVALISEVTREISLPAFAIGGINEHNVDAVVAAGATRIAVQGAVRRESPAESIRTLRTRLNRLLQTPPPKVVH